MKGRIRCSEAVINMIAFLSLVLAVVILALMGNENESILTGLVGVLGTFKPRTPTSSSENQDRGES